MTVTLPDMQRVTVNGWKGAAKAFLEAIKDLPKNQTLPEEAGEIHGGRKNFFMGKVDREGNIYSGHLPNIQKVFDKMELK